jgi:hypothetical protein
MRRATFVTGFVDIDRIERSGRRGWDVYRERFKWLLNLPINLVVYAEPDHILEIGRIPRRANLEFVRTDVDEFSSPELMRALADAISVVPDANINKRKDTPLLTLVGRQKVEWLHAQAKANVFRSDHFWWVDFGIAWDGLPKPESEAAIIRASEVEFPVAADWISICSVTYVPKIIVRDRKKYYLRYWWPVASGWFGGTRVGIERMHREFLDEWYVSLGNGCAPFDEMVHGRVMMDERRECVYIPHYGDYRSCIANTFECRMDHELVTWMANRATYFGDHFESTKRWAVMRPYMTPQRWKVYDL